jgi:HAE1 family hydrophobic/amphiphilic exporter-1
MLAIPFGIIGVVWGHVHARIRTDVSEPDRLRRPVSGIVVNDSLILVQFYNGLRDQGKPLHEALVDAGKQRLRPIMLTTITTVLGLTPLMLEKSFQAKFLIPMAISIAFGLFSATLLILLVLPCILVVIDDVKAVSYFLWHGQRRPQATDPPLAAGEHES